MDAIVFPPIALMPLLPTLIVLGAAMLVMALELGPRGRVRDRDRDQLDGHLRRDPRQLGPLARGGSRDHLRGLRGDDRWRAGEQEEQRGAERVHVGAMVHVFTARLLGRHVGRRTDHVAFG